MSLEFGISIWICYTGITIFIESYNVLMDISLDEKTQNDILNICHTYKEIKKTDDIISTPVGDILFLLLLVWMVI